ncbi:MAG: SAF domain-containing protein [Frankiaceae bacterium]
MDVASPPARRLVLPRWLNGRLAAGLLLVLVSTLLGAKVVAASDDRQPVWAARHDFPAGYQIRPSDLTAVRVRLGSAAAHYVAATAAVPSGYVLRRPVRAGELVPGDALAAPTAVDPARRVVAVAVKAGHWPQDLTAGDLVDVYATSRADGATPAPASLVLAAVPVQRVPGSDRSVFAGGDSGVAVELSVAAADVAALIGAVEASDIDLVRESGSP